MQFRKEGHGFVENLSLELKYAEITWENISSHSESTCIIPSGFFVDKSRFQLKVVFTVKPGEAYPQRIHKWIYYSKVESVASCRFQIDLCILACVMSREFTREAVMKFLPAQFSLIWCKCLLRILIHSEIFSLTKYREVLVKYSLLMQKCRFEYDTSYGND